MWRKSLKIHPKSTRQGSVPPQIPERRTNFLSLRNVLTSQLRQTLPELHQTSINSISTSKNEQYLLSSGEEKCLFWNIEKPSKPYVGFDILQQKKIVSSLEITCSKMHPHSDSLFLTGMNQNSLALCDLRQSSTIIINIDFSGRAIDFGVEVHSMKNFFTDMVSSIGSTEFTHNGKYIISR